MEKISNVIMGVIINANPTFLVVIISIVLIIIFAVLAIRYFIKCEEGKKEKEREKKAIWREVKKIKEDEERKEKEKEAKEKLEKIFEKKEIEREDFSFIVRWIRVIELRKEDEERLLELDVLKVFAEISDIKKQIVFNDDLLKYLYFLEGSFKGSYNDQVLRKILNTVENTRKKAEELDKQGYIGANSLLRSIQNNCEEVRSRN